MKHIAILLFLALGFTPTLRSQSAHKQLQQGDQLYDKKEYGKAEAAYKKAAAGYAASYNAGNAAFQQGKYEDAAELFKIAGNAGADAAAKADAWFNMGNAYLQAGKYDEAIKAYESSLRKQPNRADAKKNLQIAKKKKKEAENPPPPPPPQKPPPPPPPAPRPQNNYLDRAQQARKPEQPQRNLSPEAAKLLLDAMVKPEEQRNAQDYRELSPATRPSRVKKDW